MNRAYVALSIKAVDDDARLIEGWASTASIDRAGDIVVPKGAVYSLPLPFLLDHDHRQVVGEVHKAEVTDRGIKFWAHIKKIAEPGEVKDLCDKAWSLVKNGLRRSVSIGFSALDGEVLPNGGVKFTSWEWLELSAVGVPANAEAQITSTKNFEQGKRYQTLALPEFDIGAPAASGTSDADVDAGHKATPGASGTPKPIVKSLKPKEKPMAKTIAEQISAFEATRVAKAAELETIMTGTDGETLDAESAEAADTLTDEIKSIDDHLKRLRLVESLKASTAKAVTGVVDTKSGSDARDVRLPIQVKAQQKSDPGIEFARLAKVKALAFLSQGEHRQVDVAKALYGENSLVYGIVSKANVVAGASVSGNWAEDLVGDETSVYADFAEYLRPMTIVGKFGQGGIPNLRRVPFRTPLIGQTGGGQAYWVGEGKPKPLTAFDFNRTTLDELKVATISVVTEELLRKSSPSADAILRDALAAAVAERIDIDFIDPDKAAAAGVSPASITNGVVAIASSGNDADAIREDIRALMATFVAANNPPTSAVFIMSSANALAVSLMRNPLGQQEFPGITMNGGTLEGIPVIVSEYFAPVTAGGFVALVNASDIYFADEGGVMVDVSREASLQMLDNPTNDVVTPTATSMVSMWQTNSVAFRAERILNWAKRRASAVALLDEVNWGMPGS